MGKGTGNKSTIVFATSGVSRVVTKIGKVEFELGDDEVSSLQSEGFTEHEMHDLATMSETELESLFDTTDTIILDVGATVAGSDGKLQLGRKELVTITWAARQGESAGASFAAWAAPKKIDLPEHVNNTTQRQMVALKWLNRDDSGESVKPLFTPATAS